MSTNDYTPATAYMAFAKEASWRNNASALSTVYSFDVLNSGFDVPEVYRNRENRWRIGGGKGLDRVVEQGYGPADGSIEMGWQSAIWFYYALGACTTSGTGNPYTHTISEGNTLPSFALHYEMEHGGSNHFRRDIFGCVQSSLTLTIEKEAEAVLSMDFIGAVGGDGSNLAEPSRASLSRPYRWSDLNTTTSTLTYNNAEIDGTSIWEVCDSIEIQITNEVEIVHTFEDTSPYKLIQGPREYSLKFHIFPRTSDWLVKRNLRFDEYAGDGWECVLQFDKQGVTGPHETTFTFGGLILNESPIHMPDWTDKIFSMDITFAPAPGKTFGIASDDGLTNLYYEGA